MIDDKIEGDCTLIDDETINGMIAGTLTVESGVRCRLNGMVTGDLVARLGAAVEVNGTVSGDVVSAGAEIEISGVVEGRLRNQFGTAPIIVHPGAVVGGKVSG